MICSSLRIEEEYFIYRKKDGGAKPSMSTRFFDAAREALGDRVGPELLQSQIEVATKLCAKGAEARRQLKQFRRTLERIATDYQLGILAAGTHPTGEWEAQRPTEEVRYGRVAHDLQMIARRKMICGMHVHVAVPDRVSRVDLMVRTLPFVPLVLALSTSSPFWHSHRTGLMGYRQALHAEFPARACQTSSAARRTMTPMSPPSSTTASSPMRASSGGWSALPRLFDP